MKIKENIGIMNALIRITAGFTLLAFGTAKFARAPWRNSYLFLMICGAMKVAEGIVRYCPIVALLEKEEFRAPLNEKNKQSNANRQELAISNLDEPLDYNPT